LASERERLKDRIPFLEKRAAILQAVRAYFATQSFLEVETPARVRNPGQEQHLVAFPAGQDRFLITSPEYHMKRLLAGGLSRIVQICRCFRKEENGPFHQPEFTMIEWYRAGGTLADLMADCEAIIEIAARVSNTWPTVPIPSNRGCHAESLTIAAPFQRISVGELFLKHTGAFLRGNESLNEMQQLAVKNGCYVSKTAAWEDHFFQIWLDRIEPHLGINGPVFVDGWPIPLAALACATPGNPHTAERFELYAAGLELANAFGELIDPVEQRRRFETEMALRHQNGKTVYPIDEKLLAALGEMAPTSGIAMGFDRLVLLVTGASNLGEVQTFTDEEV
jgi:lysyl-tRNA synthetase class 2